MTHDSLLVVIFSFNRALQLDYTLRCLLSRLKTEHLEVVVVYHTTGEHHCAYKKLQTDFFQYGIKFHERGPAGSFFQDIFPRLFNVRNVYRYAKYSYLRKNRDNFKRLTEQLISSSKCNFVMFETDDNIFYKEQEIGTEVFNLIRANPLHNSFRCYVGENHHNAPATLTKEGEFLSWNYYDPTMSSHWAYPFSVDGTIYDKFFLLNLITPVLYHMPTTLEANIVSNVKSKKVLSNGYSPIQSSMVGIMLNRVANIGKNLSGKYDPIVLNKYYLDGFRLEIDLPCVVDINAVVPKSIRLIRGSDEISLSDL